MVACVGSALLVAVVVVVWEGMCQGCEIDILELRWCGYLGGVALLELVLRWDVC